MFAPVEAILALEIGVGAVPLAEVPRVIQRRRPPGEGLELSAQRRSEIGRLPDPVVSVGELLERFEKRLWGRAGHRIRRMHR